jgi:hypothetical protein
MKLTELGVSGARPLATIDNTIVARDFAMEAPNCEFCSDSYVSTYTAVLTV